MPKLLQPLEGYSREEWLSFSKGKRWRLRHPAKQKAASAAWALANKDYVSTRHRKYNLQQYGLTEEGYEALLVKQHYQCAICRTAKPTGKWKVFAVDHDHETGYVRGLLCNECNRGIGLLQDSAALLRLAADYLDRKTKEERAAKGMAV